MSKVITRILKLEKRYLVKSFDPKVLRCPSRFIRQGYLDTPGSTDIRVRILDGTDAKITRKQGHGPEAACVQLEDADLDTAQFLLDNCPDQLTKRRYEVDGWTLDIFEGALSGLVLAEYAKKSHDEEVVFPGWLHEAEDVTLSLSNRHLARLCRDMKLGGVMLTPALKYLPKRLPRVVLTGGPCSGKTTLMREFQAAAFASEIHFVPEVASIVIGQVGVVPSPNVCSVYRFQRTIYDIQRRFEEVSEQYAASDGKHLMLLDRGTVDNAAYLEDGLDEFRQVCGTSVAYEYGQYDLVLCLEPPPPDIFAREHANNPARKENYAQAVELGRRIAEVWGGHPHFVFVPNGSSWAAKRQFAKTKLLAALYNPNH